MKNYLIKGLTLLVIINVTVCCSAADVIAIQSTKASFVAERLVHEEMCNKFIKVSLCERSKVSDLIQSYDKLLDRVNSVAKTVIFNNDCRKALTEMTGRLACGTCRHGSSQSINKGVIALGQNDVDELNKICGCSMKRLNRLYKASKRSDQMRNRITRSSYLLKKELRYHSSFKALDFTGVRPPNEVLTKLNYLGELATLKKLSRELFEWDNYDWYTLVPQQDVATAPIGGVPMNLTLVFP